MWFLFLFLGAFDLNGSEWDASDLNLGCDSLGLLSVLLAGWRAEFTVMARRQSWFGCRDVVSSSSFSMILCVEKWNSSANFRHAAVVDILDDYRSVKLIEISQSETVCLNEIFQKDYQATILIKVVVHLLVMQILKLASHCLYNEQIFDQAR